MKLQKVADKLVIVLGAALCLFQLYTAFYMPFPAMQQRSVHLGLGLAMIFLIYPKKRPENPTRHTLSLCLSFVLAAISLTACLNAAFNWLDMADSMRMVFPETSDTVFGIALIVLVLWGTKRVTGWAMPIIAAIFLLYALFGKYIPIQAFRHSGV